jgi:hypothetical protein
VQGSCLAAARLPLSLAAPWCLACLGRGYETSPFCKVVREVLSELELPHLYRSCARGSPKRQAFYEQHGRFQVPYLEDPNAGVAMFESAAIMQYLRVRPSSGPCCARDASGGGPKGAPARGQKRR